MALGAEYAALPPFHMCDRINLWISYTRERFFFLIPWQPAPLELNVGLG